MRARRLQILSITALSITSTLFGLTCSSEDATTEQGSSQESTSGPITGASATGAGTGTASGSPSGGSQSGPSGGTSGGSGSGSSGSGSGGAGPMDDGVVRLIAIGDTGEGNEGQHAVADQMNEKCLKVGGCDAVLVSGDNFYDNGVESTDDPQWVAKFEEPYDRPALNGLPFYVVLGNHDYGPTSTGNKQAQIDYSTLPVGIGPGTRRSAKWTMPEAYYDLTIGDVHIFGIDTVDFTSAEQENDMSGRVTASKAPWKLVFGHHPRYTSGEHYWDNLLLGFAGMFDFQRSIFCSADIFLTGHDHDQEFIDKGRDEDCPDTHFIVSGAGSKKRDGVDFTPTDERQLFYEDEIEGFLYLEFKGLVLNLEFIDKNGSVMFSKTLTK